ncbi:hypothetical protein ACE1CI_18340 [Aerosakkonemataceae cyanobacterium BLCC-F50]|uniref:Uncharacterized protein n=1 Tax=Floridaenema flaviceps BLCC-F50 TaxID=3153642 RepID=A0ABV4XT67_9CYAN
MDADLLVRDFYSALSRDLLIYMIVVAVAATVAWCSWFRRSAKHRRAWLAAAIVLTVIGGGLIGAAYSYRVGIPAKLETDLVSAQTNLNAARQAIINRYGAERGVPHFQRLAIIWTVVGGIAIAIMLTLRRPAVIGIGSAVLFLCIASFVLDLSAFMRDMVYTAQWMKLGQ